MKSNILSKRDDTQVEISSSGFVMCKINRCLIISSLMTSELERPMIFYLVFQTLITKYQQINAYISFFATVRSPCISISKLKMLTFYFNILIETIFLTIKQYIEMLTFDRI